MVRRFVLLLPLLFSFHEARSGEGNPVRFFFIQPEFIVGKNVRIYGDFPPCGFRRTFLLDLGYIHRDSSSAWVNYYNFPNTGISLGYTDFGNPAVFGREYSIIPYALLKSSRDPRRSFDLKIGLGLSYCTRPYNAETNPENLVIGTKFNWGLQFLAYKSLYTGDHINIRIGGGFIHTSDSHTVLPNYGMNSAVLSLAMQFTGKKYDPLIPVLRKDSPLKKSRHYFLQLREGLGWHQLGGTTDPLGGPEYLIDNYTVAGGIFINPQLKLSTGFTYRYYHSFYHYIMNTPDIQWGTDPSFYRDHPKLKSSDFIFYLGCEFLLNHIGFEINEGLNLYKPFYREFNARWEFHKGFKYDASRFIASRIGLNYYLVNPYKMPKNNLWAGAHINANFGKADFMELCLGYCLVIR